MDTDEGEGTNQLWCEDTSSRLSDRGQTNGRSIKLRLGTLSHQLLHSFTNPQRKVIKKRERERRLRSVKAEIGSPIAGCYRRRMR